MTERLTVEDLELTVLRAPRADIEIMVDRDGSVVVRAPEATPLDEVERAVSRRANWIYRQLAAKRAMLRLWSEPEYRQGDTVAYLGRAYRLRYADGAVPPLRLMGAWFELARPDAGEAAARFRDWYVARGKEWLPRRVALVAPRLGVTPGRVVVRDLGYRWASCGRSGISFSWQVMTLPPAVIDYIILHELAHTVEPRHGRAFWDVVAKAMPDFEQRRVWLSDRGRRGLSVA